MPDEVLLGLIERLAVPILLVDGEGLVLGANKYLARIGIEPGRLPGMPLSGITAQPPEVVYAYLRRCSRTSDPLPGSLVLKKEGGGEIPCRADGSVVHAASRGCPAVVLFRLELKDDGVGRFLALNQKIDDLGKEIRRRKRIEGDLREQKEWLGVTLTSIGDAVIATDTEGRVIFMNPVAEVLTGWGRGEAGGRELGEVFRIINEESRKVVEDPVAKCLREGTVVGLANHTILLARDGTEYAIDDTAAPIRDANGDLKGAVLVFHDVGDRRRLERELHDRADRLAENDRRKDEFLAMLAHELRNPLASINNAAQLFGKLKDEAGLRWAQDVVLRQVRHLARLIDDLLDVSRISRGKIDLRREPLGLASAIDQAVEAVRPLLQERGHEFRLCLVDEEVRLEADPIRLDQILVNLLTNAAKYTEPGGQIRLAASQVGSEVVITISDTGIGIPAELLPRVFDLFTQGDRSLARSEGGLGIGLTLVRRLAEMHGGSVVAASEGPGKGSEFTVRLPALL